MFGLGAWEIIVIMALALIVLGPQKLPELAKQLARMMGELRRVADEVRTQFDEATYDRPEPPPALVALPPVAHDSAAERYHEGLHPGDTPPSASAVASAGALGQDGAAATGQPAAPWPNGAVPAASGDASGSGTGQPAEGPSAAGVGSPQSDSPKVKHHE